MIKKVTQKHGMGCGVACVAAVLNFSYDKALHLFKNPKKAWTKGYFCKDIVAALKKKKRNYDYKYLKNSRDPVLKKSGTIVFTRFSKAYPHGHYLIRTKNGWMNPWINFPEITPAKSGFSKRLPARPTYAIFGKDDKETVRHRRRK